MSPEAPRGNLSRARNGGMPWRHVLDVGELGSGHPPLPAASPPATPPPATETAPPEPDGQAVSLITALIWYRRLVLLVILGTTGLGGAAGVTLQPLPTAVAQIAVLDPRGNSVLRQGVTSEASFQTYTAQRAVFAASTEVLIKACDQLREQGLHCSAVALNAQVKTSVSDSGAMIDISASAGSGADAVEIADAVVAAYRDLASKDLQAQVTAQQQAVNSAIGSLTKTVPQGLPGSVTNNAAASTMSQLQARAANAAVDASSALDGTRFVVAAQLVPDRRLSVIGRGVGTGAGVGFLVAVILGYALADRVPATFGRRPHSVRRAQRTEARLAAWEREHPIPDPDRSRGEWPPQAARAQPRPTVDEPQPDLFHKRPADAAQESDRYHPTPLQGGAPGCGLPRREPAVRPREFGEGDD